MDQDNLELQWYRETGQFPEKDSKVKPPPTEEEIKKDVEEGKLLP